VVVFTDGTDQADISKRSPSDVIEFLKRGLPVQVWIVTYGSDAASAQNLAAITTASQGRMLAGNDTDCDAIFDRF
jgi:hypothetical protein